MAKQIQLRRGTEAENNAFTGALAELTVDITNKTLRLHDSVTAGGVALVNSATNQTITGVKTFTSSPVVPAPTTDSQTANKTYVDAKIGPAWVANDARAKTALNATGTAPIYACRAWVNFNGTGTVAIRASGNVSSITDNGVGNYTVNFTTAMPDANYSVTSAKGTFDLTSPGSAISGEEVYNLTASSFIWTYLGINSVNYDMRGVGISVFR